MSLKRYAPLVCVGLAVLVCGATPASAVSPTLVISQVYGGGGNAGATLKQDFMELHNRGTTPVDVTGWSVQYAATGGTTWTRTTLSGTIQPGRYYLIRQAPGAGGTTDIPNADAIGTTAMSATAGKVVLASNNTTILAGTVCPSGIEIVDIVGYGSGTTCSEGSPTGTLSNTTAALRNDQGCAETDNNSADFTVGSPNPRNSFVDPHFCDAESAPSVTSTTPANSATGVARNSNITINFSEPVSVAGSWYSISCGSSGAHSAAQSGGPSSFTLDPDADFAFSETCTVTVSASQVSDQDAFDPPDNMAADHIFSFTTETAAIGIHDVQGASHLSPYNGQAVAVDGVVIAERGSNVWLQDPAPDADSATSEGILVFGSLVANAVVVGDLVRVRGTVTEFRAGCSPSCSATSSAFDNLTITEIAAPGLSATRLGTASLPAATVIGSGGRVPPNQVIEDDSSSGNVETSGVFDPAQDGIDFYETLESMLVQVNNPVVVGPRNSFGEILVLADDGAGAGVRTTRGGIVIRDVDPTPLGDYRSGDFNPERIMLDDLFMATPSVDVADHFNTAPAGVMTYDFANFKIAVTNALTAVDGGLEREVARLPFDWEIAVATYNVENLDPGDPADSFSRHADLIVNHLQSPDLIAIEEIQDNNGPANDAVTDASVTWNMLIAEIQAAGGPVYEYRQIDPVDDQDGGEPGGNIRVGFLFRTDRGLTFIDRPGGGSTTPTAVVDTPSGPRLSFSPGRVDPTNAAFSSSRKPLAGEFRMHGKKVFVIANHFSSKGGDDPIFGRFQPPVRSSEVARHAQAQVVNDFVDDIVEADPDANVIVLGDINDFDFSETVQILEGGVLSSLMHGLPQAERYSYVFEGNSQVLDQILVSNNMLASFGIEYDPVHVNSEFADQASDHDPQVARLDLRGRPSPKR